MRTRPSYPCVRCGCAVSLRGAVCLDCRSVMSVEEARAWGKGQKRVNPCCDGTGWTGNPRERCVKHYSIPGFGAGGLR